MVEGDTRKASRRRSAVGDFKRELIRAAAREVFLKRGLADTTLREIAKRAGCTTGAIYAQYSSKEEVYGDILRQSLAELLGLMLEAQSNAKSKTTTTHMLRVIYVYYQVHTAEFELGFYLKSGAARVGLGRALNRELNIALKAIFDLVADCLVDDGRSARRTADRRAVLLITGVFGILLMHKTGRLSMLQQDPRELLEEHISDP